MFAGHLHISLPVSCFDVGKGVIGENSRPVRGFGAVDILLEVSFDAAFVYGREELFDLAEGNSILGFVKSEEAASETHLNALRCGIAKSGSRNRRLNLSLTPSLTLSSASISTGLAAPRAKGLTDIGELAKNRNLSKRLAEIQTAEKFVFQPRGATKRRKNRR
jgi:hypothetical protein